MIHREMDQDEKVIEVDRQIRAGGHIWCPWCRAVNMPGKDRCCVAFSACVDDRAAAQIQSVVDQQAAIERGEANALVCPYCTTLNVVTAEPLHQSEWIRPMRSPFCCDELQRVAIAVFQRKKNEEAIRRAEMIGEAVDKAARN